VHVAQYAWDIGVGAGNAQKDSRVACSWIRHECHHAHTNDCPRAVEYNDQTSFPVSIRDPGCSEHPRRSEDVGWETHDLAQRDRIAHVISQDDGQEVAPRVRHDVIEKVEPCELPNFPVAEVECNTRPRQLVCYSVPSISLNAAEYDASFVCSQERSAGNRRRLGRLVWERNDSEVACYSE
jgi:hypothetical protein